MIYRTYTKKKNILQLIVILLVVVLPMIVVLMISVAYKQGFGFFIFLPVVVISTYLLRQEGVVLDFKNQRYKKVTYYLFMEFGHWEQLPEISRLVLSQSKDFVNTSSKFEWAFTGYRKMCYALALENSSRNFQLEIIHSEDQDEVYELARALEKVIGVRIEEMNLN